MSKILIFTEYTDTAVKNVSLEILGRLSGHTRDVVAIGALPAAAADQLKKYGADNISKITGTDLQTFSPEGYASVLKDFISVGGYDYVFAGSTSLGKDLFPRIAGMFDSGMVTELVDFKFEGEKLIGSRPLYAGKCIADVEILGNAPKFVTVRPNALGLVETPTAGSGSVVDLSGNAGNIRAKIKEIVKGASGKVDLTEANIIVSGGRALKSKENFKILEELADVLGATVGASRAAVDSDYAEHSMQVGQTGKVVAPSLYIACGISGAIQHLAGMRTSKVIVAINSDPDAPIFSYADYGIVGDLFKIVPILKEEIQKIIS